MQTDALVIGYRQPISQALDLALRAGELVCLIGANGIGKSTLLRTLAGMQTPLAGQIRVGGQPLASLSDRQRAQQISIVLTERTPPGMVSGWELVALGRHPHTDWMGQLSDDDKNKVRWAVAQVAATELAPRPLVELSDGERQKLWIARALAQETPVMLLDEPTAFLDLPHRVEVMQTLRTLAHQNQQAILLSTHDLEVALRSADRLWLMMPDAVGVRVEVGTPEDLILSGAFEAAFPKLSFDRATGHFVIPQHPAGQVALICQTDDPIRQHWTRRALERAGYAVVTGGGDHPQVIISEQGWQLQNQTYADLEQLLAALAEKP